MNVIKFLYYKLYVLLVTKYWLRICLELILYFSLLYLIFKIFGGSTGNTPSTEVTQIKESLSELTQYKEMLSRYMHMTPMDVEGNINLMKSKMFVKIELEAHNLCQTNVQNLEDNTDKINQYVQQRFQMLPKLTEVEKMASINYLSTVIAYNMIFAEGLMNNKELFKTYCLDVRDQLMQDATEILNNDVEQVSSNNVIIYIIPLIVVGPILVYVIERLLS